MMRDRKHHGDLRRSPRSPSIARQAGRTDKQFKEATIEGVLSGMTVIAIVVCLGYAVGRLDVIGPGAEEVLSRLTFFVATPALLFSTLARADVRSVLSAALLVTVVSTLSAVVLFVLVAGALWRRSLAETIVGALASSYVNAANLGIPVAVYVLGTRRTWFPFCSISWWS